MKTINNLTLASVTLVLPIGGSGQNLVSNPSFEQYTQCPSIGGFDVYCVDWRNPTDASPDLCNACDQPGGGSVSVPYNGWGYQPARTGVGYARIITYNTYSDYTEYIQTDPISLRQGREYDVRFFASLANGSEYATRNLGCHISTDNLSQSNDGPINVNPSYQHPSYILDTAGWTEINVPLFSPAEHGDYYITIGNFSGNHYPVPTGWQAPQTGPSGDHSFLFIDDVSVTPLECCNRDMYFQCTDDLPEFTSVHGTIYIGENVIQPPINGFDFECPVEVKSNQSVILQAGVAVDVQPGNSFIPEPGAFVDMRIAPCEPIGSSDEIEHPTHPTAFHVGCCQEDLFMLVDDFYGGDYYEFSAWSAWGQKVFERSGVLNSNIVALWDGTWVGDCEGWPGAAEAVGYVLKIGNCYDEEVFGGNITGFWQNCFAGGGPGGEQGNGGQSGSGNNTPPFSMAPDKGLEPSIAVTPSGTSEPMPKHMTVQPNPTRGTVIIGIPSDNAVLTITNSVGQVVERAAVNGGQHEIDLSSYGRGVFIVSVSSDGQTWRKKVVVQ